MVESFGGLFRRGGSVQRPAGQAAQATWKNGVARGVGLELEYLTSRSPFGARWKGGFG